MKVYKLCHFHQWAKKEKLTDSNLKQAVFELEKGLHDGRLGGGLYKKRIAKMGQGKSGGYRTLLAFSDEHHTFFIYGFAKNVLENINDEQKFVYRKLAKELLASDEDVIQKMLVENDLIEVK